MTTPVTNAPAAAPTTDTTALGKASLASNFDTFLSLLTTQLKNQDPLSPLDSNQFTQQLVQMTGVEQQLAANDLLKQVVSNTGSGVATAVSLIGKQVRAASDTASIFKGQAQWTYNLPATAGSLKVEVLDSKGKVVHTEAPTNMGAGDHPFTWNGKDLTGNQLPDGGVYTLRVTAKDPSGTVITASNFLEGVVTGVQQSNGSTFLTINGSQATADKVVSVALAPTTPTAPASS